MGWMLWYACACGYSTPPPQALHHRVGLTSSVELYHVILYAYMQGWVQALTLVLEAQAQALSNVLEALSTFSSIW